MATGLPSSLPGTNFQLRWTSFTAASSSLSKPLLFTTETSLQRPSSFTKQRNCTVPASPARRDAGGYSGSEVREPLPVADGGVLTTARSTGFATGGGAATGRSDVVLEMAVLGPVSIARSTDTSGGGT